MCEVFENQILGWQVCYRAVKQCSVLLLVAVWTVFMITG